MNVYEHRDPSQFRPRTHPWVDAESDADFRYIDFRAYPEQIRTELEDWHAWRPYPATQTFFRLLEWLNGADSTLESNDCAFTGPARNSNPASDRPMECTGRVMVLFRDLRQNTDPQQVRTLFQNVGIGLSEQDTTFEDGAIGMTLVPVWFTTLQGSVSEQQGQQLMLSFWAWGDDPVDVMANLDRTLGNLRAVLESL